MSASAQLLYRKQAPGTSTLLKVLAAYVVAVLLLQGLAAAFALGAGPLHRHRPAAALVQPGSTAALLSHHGHAHANNERHHHGAGDSTVVADAAAQAAADAAAQALAVALSLLALQTPRAAADLGSHVLVPATGWFWHTLAPAPLNRPPIQA